MHKMPEHSHAWFIELYDFFSIDLFYFLLHFFVKLDYYNQNIIYMLLCVYIGICVYLFPFLCAWMYWYCQNFTRLFFKYFIMRLMPMGRIDSAVQIFLNNIETIIESLNVTLILNKTNSLWLETIKIMLFFSHN